MSWTCKIIDIPHKFHELPTSKNLIGEWPNKSNPTYFQYICQICKIVANFFDELLDGYNVEMLIKTIYEPIKKNVAKVSCWFSESYYIIWKECKYILLL